MKTTEKILEIAAYGSNIVVDASKPVEHLLKIVEFVKAKGGHVTVKDASRKPADLLVKIAVIGKDSVTFDFTENE